MQSTLVYPKSTATFVLKRLRMPDFYLIELNPHAWLSIGRGSRLPTAADYPITTGQHLVHSNHGRLHRVLS